MNANNKSFPGNQRIHIGLASTNVARSIEFYTALFAEPPVKIRPGYAKFEPQVPSVNLSLNEVSAVLPYNSEAHFGIQVKSSEQLAVLTQRLQSAGLSLKFENQVTCCYAVQDKIWARDPDGHAWEVFMVTGDDAATASDSETTGEESCCGPTCCEDNSKSNSLKVSSASVGSADSVCCGLK